MANINEKTNEDKYLEWLCMYLSLLKSFTAIAEQSSPDIKATMISFLRTAEHVFNFFINHRRTYEFDSDFRGVQEITTIAPAMRLQTINNYDDLKTGRNEVANRIICIIKGDPIIRKRFESFCDNLKEPGAFGFFL